MGESARLEEASLEIDSVLRQWAAAAARKAGAEFPQRLNLWRAYLEGIPERQASPVDYAHPVRHRVIAERLLTRLTPLLRDQRQRLDALDELLRMSFRTGAFVWDPPLAAVYPQPAYWFLYGGLHPPAAGTR